MRYPWLVAYPLRLPIIATVLSLSLLLSSELLARSEGEARYTLKQTYSTTLRYLRVELGFEILERDPEAAYLLFKYIQPGAGKQVVDASIELVETKEYVRVVVRIPAMPSYHEKMLRDGLLKKLLQDYGEPIAPPKPRKRAKPKQAPDEPKQAPEGKEFP